jgi:hypothetical protein
MAQSPRIEEFLRLTFSANPSFPFPDHALSPGAAGWGLELQNPAMVRH